MKPFFDLFLILCVNFPGEDPMGIVHLLDAVRPDSKERVIGPFIGCSSAISILQCINIIVLFSGLKFLTRSQHFPLDPDLIILLHLLVFLELNLNHL